MLVEKRLELGKGAEPLVRRLVALSFFVAVIPEVGEAEGLGFLFT